MHPNTLALNPYENLRNVCGNLNLGRKSRMKRDTVTEVEEIKQVVYGRTTSVA
jgi:hypothetical protein